ncbi:DNA-binding protein [Naasia sp. SYSU D00948]|uniref:DNA-binding protein n=1 Tax=Naasia sp. SYSU D00948 TaxID=2817379 RepID=UPI001B31163D|nr:DNA-binding protein [Naasia sp. SYSU D00948]
MFVLTVDQVDSRNAEDRVRSAIDIVTDQFGEELVLPPERSAGDEFQTLTRDAHTALAVVLALTRRGHWSVGLGVGPVREPLPESVREATGPAFVAARSAVEQAKKAPHRFWLVADGRGLLDGEGVRALLELVLAVRARRSDEGWEVIDLLRDGRTQAAAAEVLGISPQAVSLRLSAAQWRLEEAALPALVLLLEDLDRGVVRSTIPSPGAP